MQNSDKIAKALTEHCKTYPRLCLKDIFKYIYQSSFGCEHLAPAEETAAELIRREYAEKRGSTDGRLCTLDGEYSRVPLSCIDGGLSPETLGRLFCRSAKTEKNGMVSLLDKLSVLRQLVRDGAVPFSAEELESEVTVWSESGFAAVHHSEGFRSTYNPSYRVVSRRYADFISVFSLIDKAMAKSGKVVLAIEGGSASGKTTLAAVLNEIYGCTVFHMDDFFLRPEQRTPERFAEAGGNVDRERFYDEVLTPLDEGREVLYRRFDCETQSILPPVTVRPTPLTVIEGAYSMHPLLAPFYSCSVFLDISPERQKERILKRNTPELAQRFFNEWIPLEGKYFSEMSVKDRCSLSITVY